MTDTKPVQIEHSGDGTLLSIDRNDVTSRAAAKAAGFKWSGNLNSWYLPRNWSESTRRYKVEQLTARLGADTVHVEDRGHGKTTTAAEREAAKIANAQDRVERMTDLATRKDAESESRHTAARKTADLIPFGQPILVGHHSEGRHRRDLERINSNYDKSFAAAEEADAARRSAANAEHTANGDDPLKRQRRIDRNEAEIRRIDRILLTPSASGDDRLTSIRNELADTVQYDKAQIAASGHVAITAAAIAVGDVIEYRGRSHVVAKVNKTTVSVPTGYSWLDKVLITQITRHHPKDT